MSSGRHDQPVTPRVKSMSPGRLSPGWAEACVCCIRVRPSRIGLRNKPGVAAWLLADAELADHIAVAIGIVLLQVIQQAAAL